MALDFSIFETEMAKLQSAFGRRVHSEAYDHWYEMAKHLTDYKFREVMAKLQFGDKFPSFKVFRDTEYNLSETKHPILTANRHRNADGATATASW